jgi:hypothetical protein
MTNKQDTAPETSKENVFYLVLHGFISLIDVGDDGFVGLVLDMGDAHAYLYGDWLFEQTLPVRAPGQFPLHLGVEGVDSYKKDESKNTLDSSKNVVVKLDSFPSLPNPSVRALLFLPRPRQIYYAISGTIDPNSIQGTKWDIGRIQGTPAEVSGVKVFEYTCKTFEAVKLVHYTNDTNPYWCPTPDHVVELVSKRIAILHIYDEPQKTMLPDEAAQHTVDEFNASLKVLGVQVQLTKKADDHVTLPSPIDGLLLEELDTLDKRSLLTLDLLNQQRAQGANDNTNPIGGGTGGQVCSGAHAVITPGAFKAADINKFTITTPKGQNSHGIE